MYKSITYIAFGFFLFLSSCTSTNKVLTTNVQDITSFEPNSYIYSLPKTKVVISVTALRHTIIPGPYHAFAQKYLGIEGVPSISEVQWVLNGMQLSSAIEADPEHYYSVAGDNHRVVKNCLDELSRSGLVINPGSYSAIEKPTNFYEDETPRVKYADLTIKRNFEKGQNASSGRQIKDSAFVMTSFNKKSIQAKTIEKKAEEAANFIIKTRKRKFKLVAGQYEVFPEGVALETAINELDKTEAEYLSLFIGKTYTDTIKRVVIYEPEARQELQRSTIFRFSDETGIITSRSAVGKAVILEITDLGRTKILEHMIIPGDSPSKQNMVFYRLPDNAEVKVLFGSYEIANAQMSISQFGAIIPYYIPEKMPKK